MKNYIAKILATSLAVMPMCSYAQEFKDYKDGDKVMMIHKGIADTTKVGLELLSDFMKERGGTNSVVGISKTITQTDTVYSKEKINQFINSNSLESKTNPNSGKHWYNSGLFKFFVLPSVCLTAGYFINDNIDNKKSKPSDDNTTENPSGTIIDYSESGGIRGDINNKNEAGGNR